MVGWRNLCPSPASNRLNPALQQYYAEETEEFFTNLANGLDNLVVTLGPDSVRAEWLELAVTFLRTTHSEVQVLLDKLKHYSPLGSKSDPDWLVTYMDETAKLLDVCTRLKPGLVRIENYQMCVELASRALSMLNLDAIQADLRRCLYRGDGAGAKTGPDQEDQALGSKMRKRSPPSRESFEFPVSGSPAMETSPVMPSSPNTAMDACRKADKIILSIERMNLNSPSKGGDARIDVLASDTLSLKSQYLALDGQGSEGDESCDTGLEDLESLVAEAEKLLYMRRPGSLSEPPPPPPGMFDGPPIPRDTGSPLRPFKLDSNFKIDISPSKSSDSSTSPHTSRRRSSDVKPGAPRKPPVYPLADRGALEPAAAKDTCGGQVSGEAEPGSSGSHSRQASAEVELGSTHHSRQVSFESSCPAVTLEHISAPLVSQFEASLNALRECKEAISREWRPSAESQKLIVDPMQTSTSRSGLSASFTKYFRHRASSESTRRKSSGEGSKLAQFLETLTADRDVEAEERRGSLDTLNTISPSAWVEKGMSPIREGQEGQGKESPKAPSVQVVKDVKKLSSSNQKMLADEVPLADAKLPQGRQLPKDRTDTTNQATSTAALDQSRWGLFYGAGNPSRVPTMVGTQQQKVEGGSPEATKPSATTTGHASVSLSVTKGQSARQSSTRRRSQSLDEVGIERLHLDFLDSDSPETTTPSPKASQDLTSPQGLEASSSRGSGGAHRKSASFDRLKPYGNGGWRSERTEAIIRAYQNRRKALPTSPEPTVEIRPSEDGNKGVAARKVERVDVYEGASLLKKFPEGTSNFVGAPSQRGSQESQARRIGEGASVGHGGAQTSRTTDTKLEKGMPGSLSSSFDTTAEQPRITQASSASEAKHLKPLGPRTGGQNVANIVAKFESFFDAEFETKHDIKRAGGHGSRDWSAEFDAKMRIYDNPLHQAPPAASPVAPVKGRRKSSSPSRLWRISASPFDSGGWRRNASSSPSPSRPSKEQGSKGGPRLVTSVSPGKRDRSRSTSSSPGRLSLFSQVKHWVSHHQGHDHEDHTHEAPKPGSTDLRRSRSSNLSKPNTPSHALLRSPGRLSMNLVTIQRSASSLVKNFGHVALKQCSNPMGGNSRWSGLGGVFLATRATTGLVSSFLVWVLARSEGGNHPSRLDYTITKSEFHWALSLRKLQEKVSKFDKGQSPRTSADTRTSFALGLPDAIAADGQIASSSLESDRKGRKRWSLDLKRRRPSSEHHRQNVDEYKLSSEVVPSSAGPEGSSIKRPSSQWHEDSAFPEAHQSQPGLNPCLHIQELKEVHDCVEELHAGLESLFSSCLSVLGKNRTELEQLPQEKIIRECVPSESSESGMRRRLFDKVQGDAVSARPIQVERKSTAAQEVQTHMPKGRQKPGSEEPVPSTDSPQSNRMAHCSESAQARSHHISYSGSSFSFELDNGVDEHLKHVEAIFVEWRSGKMAKTMRRLQHCTEELRGSLDTVSREVDELFGELETGRRTLVD